jgi:uncharacterized membrane protein (UPF0127 family)
MLNSRRRRRRQLLRFFDLLVADAFEAPSLALAARPQTRPRGVTRPAHTEKVVWRGGRVVCERCTIADSPVSRMRGLLGRRDLEPDEGLLLRPAGSVHTFFMRFAIDAVFLDRERRVVRVAEHIRPWRAAGARGARAVLELRAGESARRGISVGDVLDVGDLR